MKKLFLIPILALTLLTGGCTTTGSIDQARIQQTIADIQAAATALCSFTPSLTTVTNILSAIGVPYVGIVPEVADQICGAIVRRSGAGTPRLVVRGKSIPITGHFVRRR